jgi:hypothetical protein
MQCVLATEALFCEVAELAERVAQPGGMDFFVIADRPEVVIDRKIASWQFEILVKNA